MGLFRELFVPYKISSTNFKNFSKLIILKNFMLICVSVMFAFAAVNGIGGVQSTINKEGGLGLASSTVVYCVFGLSGIMIPQLLMNFIKFKWTLSLGLFLQLFYVGLNAYPTYLTYLPASALGGLGQALIFTAAGTSIQKLCQLYCEITSADAARTQGIFFGVFGSSIQIANVLGNLLVAIVFGKNEETKQLFENTSNISVAQFNYSQCGSAFCPSTELPPSAAPSLNRVYLLVGILGVSSMMSVLLSIFLNDVDYIVKEEGIITSQIVRHQVNELKKQFLQVNQILAAPMSMMNGYFLTFLWVDFTRSFAACSAGLDYIGWSSIILYASAGIFSPIFGKIATSFTIAPVFIFYWALTIGTSIFMLYWQSNPDSLYMLFTLAALLGTIESINTPLPRALYGMIFKTEVVYSAFTLFQGIGMLTGFLITTFCCTKIKVIVLIGFAVVSTICGIFLYVKNFKSRKYESRTKANIHEIEKLNSANE